jgi:DHA3 family tetracycline resistance protein-like MFS transporter
VPTGVLADTYSRRLSAIIGFALVGVCYLIEGFVPLFVAILLAELIRGIGETFVSGAFDAWIADEVGEERAGRAYLRASQLGYLCSFLGIGLGALLGSWQLNFPIYLGGGLILGLAVLMVLTMGETGFQPASRAHHAGHSMWITFRRGVEAARAEHIILLLLAVGVVFGAFSEGFDRLGEAHFLQNFHFPAWGNLTPVVWLGIINAGGTLLSFLVAEIVIRRLDLRNSAAIRWTLFALNALLMLCVIGFGLSGSFGLAVLLYWAAGVFRSLQHPLTLTWLNRYISPQVRATVLSMFGQADALGQMAGGPVVGLVGLRSLRAAMLFAGLILSPALLLYGRAGRQISKDPTALAPLAEP